MKNADVKKFRCAELNSAEIVTIHGGGKAAYWVGCALGWLSSNAASYCETLGGFKTLYYY